MTNTLFGRLSAHTLQSSDSQTRPTQTQSDLIGLISDRITPPTPLTAADMHIRAMRLVSDQVNDHGGRFPREEHEHLCELLTDSPVMIGHDHSALPVARNFAARCVSEGEESWVEVWFYWLRGDGPHHDQLAADIDAGVVKEGSIGFEFALPQCSICNDDIRTCEHIPGFDYNGVTAHYEYRNIQRVLETSLVYRGATPGTHIVTYPIFEKLSRTATGPLTRPLRGRPLPEGKANKPESEAIDLNSATLPDLLPNQEQGVRSPLPLANGPERSRGREVALRRDSVAERVRGPVASAQAPPALLRPQVPSLAEGAFLASFREVRSFYCPARSDLWPRSVYDFRAGHGPLARAIRRKVIR